MDWTFLIWFACGVACGYAQGRHRTLMRYFKASDEAFKEAMAAFAKTTAARGDPIEHERLRAEANELSARFMGVADIAKKL
jgi:hypothetical protein